METRGVVVVALLVVLAGCNVGFGGPRGNGTPDGPGTDAPGGDGGTGPNASFSYADPDGDRLGWEQGYWHNESLPVNASDGLNQSELETVVARSMARVERIRGLEFQREVPVEVVDRATYRERFAADETRRSAAFRAFDNAKFEALFLVGEDRSSLAVQNRNRGQNVLGFYTPRNDSIVVVSEGGSTGGATGLGDELTLGHELVHAIQDQHFNLSRYERPTRETYNAYNGLFEGDAKRVELRYRTRCEARTWNCVRPASGAGGGSDGEGADDGGTGDGGAGSLHVGVYALNYFPYSDGPGFVSYVRQRGGYERVNALYDDPPASTEQVIHPPKYGEDQPTAVTLADRAGGDWTRVRPEPARSDQVRADYASLGQSGLASMFAYTLYDSYNRSSVIQPDEFLNREGRSLNRTDPFEYGFSLVDGWDGDKMYVYRSGNAPNETAYVWKLAWDDASEAREFARGYRRLLSHYGGRQVGDGTWRIDDGPFADAFYLEVRGDTVVIANAPTESALGEVYPPAGAGGDGSASRRGA